MYVNRNSAGMYQCVAWIGSAALASVPAKLTIASISLDGKIGAGASNTRLDASRNGMPPQITHWKVSPNNSIVINCGEIFSNPAPAWSFFK